MSKRHDPNPDDHDDWLAAEGAPEPGAEAGEGTRAGGEGTPPLDAESPETGELGAAEREQRRQEREARRRDRGEAGGSASLGASLSGSFRRLFSSGSHDHGADADAGGDHDAELDPDVEPESDAGLGVDAGLDQGVDIDQGAEDHGAALGVERADHLDDSGAVARSGRGVRTPRGLAGSRPAVYARRRLMAGGAIVAALVLIVLVVLVVGSRGGSEEVPPPVAAPTMDITIPEGLSREQIADVAKEAGVRGNYKADSKSSSKIDLAEYGADGAETLEGFLFPATYNLNENGTARQLVTRQLQAFEQNIQDVSMKYARSKNLTPYDVVKIASMIEREIMVPKERRLAAAVIYNRLSIDQALGLDSTIRFEDANYDEQLTQSRLDTDSPFNTRIRTGLPPTPIGNPGLAAIKAAANPKRNDVRFFVVKPGTCGEHVFTASEDEFLQAAAEYQQALEREGGSPTDCPE